MSKWQVLWFLMKVNESKIFINKLIKIKNNHNLLSQHWNNKTLHHNKWWQRFDMTDWGFWWIFSSQISRQREDHVYKCLSVILTNADESHDWFLSSVRSRHSISFKCLHLPLVLSKYGNNFFQIGHYTVQIFLFFILVPFYSFNPVFFFYPHASCVLECILPMLQICQTSVEWSVIMGCQIMIQDAHRHSPLKCQNMLCSSVLLQAIFRDVKDSSKEPSHQIYELKMIFWNKFEDLTVV